MQQPDNSEMKNFIFASVFLMAQRWQYVGDQYLAEAGITTKQWLLMAVVVKLFEKPPTISEAAEAMGSSRQNVKQIALKLQTKGFLKIKGDDKDNRILRLKVTKKNKEFWQKRTEQDAQTVEQFFGNLSEKEVRNLFSILIKMNERTQALMKSIQVQKG